MLKRILTTTLLILVFSHKTLAASGALFAIQESGDTLEAPAVITICANILAQVSCQNFTVTRANLGITTTTGHNYALAGIKIDTSTFKVLNASCPTSINGFCSIPLNDRTPVEIPITTTGVRLASENSTHTEVGVAYSQTNTASGGLTPYTFSVFSGSLPAGTSLNTLTGVVSGTPNTSGVFHYVIQVEGADGSTAVSGTTGTMATQLAITATDSERNEVGQIYSQTNVASGGTSPYTYSLASGTLPDGTSLDTSTGTVSGHPTIAGSYTYSIQVADSDGGIQTTTPGTTTIIAGTVSLVATPSTYTEANVAYSQVNTVVHGVAPFTYSLYSGTLPSGTTLNTSTGTVSGTPANSGAGAFSYTIEVTDDDGAMAIASSSGTIYSQLTITPTASTNKEVNVAYSQTNVASGGDGSYTYSLASGTLPTGTTLDTATGTVSGTPSASGAFTYTIRVTDGNGGSATTSSITGTINPVLAITPTASTNKEVNVAYSQN